MLHQSMLESSLLYRKADGTSDFVHDTISDFFLASYYTIRINSGTISVEEIWNNNWSYEEDKGLWGLESLVDDDGRALLPDWQPVVSFLLESLAREKTEELIGVLSENYFRAKEVLRSGGYNPFFGDLIFVAKTVVDHGLKSIDRIRDELISVVEESIKGKSNYSKELVTDSMLTLARFDDQTSINFLIKCLEFKDYKTQASNAIETCKNATPYLVQYIDHENNPALTEVFNVLRKVGDQSAMPSLKKYFHGDDGSKCLWAAYALGNILGDEFVPELVEKIMREARAVGKQDGERSDCAHDLISCLGEINTDSSIDALLEFIEEEDNPFTDYALNVIGKIKCERSVSVLVKHAKKCTEPGETYKFMCALREMESEEAMNFFDEYLRNADRISAHYAFLALEVEGCERATPILIKYAKDKKYAHRENAFSALCNLGSKSSASFLIECLQDGSYDKVSAALALGEMRSTEALPVLIDFFRHGEDDGRAFIAKYLLAMCDKEAVPLIKEYIDDKSNVYRHGVADDLGKWGGKEAVPILNEYMLDRTNQWRHEIAWHLGQIGSTSSIPFLVSYINEKYDPRIPQAVSALGYIKSVEAIPVLVEYARTAEPNGINFGPHFAITALMRLGAQLGWELVDEHLQGKRDETMVMEFYKDEISRIGGRRAIQSLLNASPNCELYCYIHSTHQSLKPKGYVPQEKKLVA